MISAYTIPRRGKTISNEGGEVFTITPLQQLERFLYLGAVGGTFYATEAKHVAQNLSNVEEAINTYGREAVDMIVNVGENAPKHDHVLVAYAIAISAEDDSVRSYALSQFNKVVRTGTHLFSLLEYIKGRRGWGGGFRRAVSGWYLAKSNDQLAYAVMKYKNRAGWSHRDVLRKAHPQATNQSQNAIFKFVTSGELLADDSRAHAFIEAALEASVTDDINRAIALVREFNLPREVINTVHMRDPRMWEALLPKMGMTALFRNLRNMHKSGFLVQGSDAERDVVRRVTDQDAILKGRIHPVQIFLARQNAMYEVNRNSYWDSRTPLKDFPQSVTNALEDGFYKSFGVLEPINERILAAVDVSGSMTMPIGGTTITSAEWAAVLAMVTVRQAPFAEVYGFSHEFIDLGITPHDSLDDVMRKTNDRNFGWTDCALPFVHARERDKTFDAFVIYTDSETGGAHNVEGELARYRRHVGNSDVKLSVVATESNDISIGNPNDPNVLNVCGFSPQTPMLLEKFIGGKG